MKNYLLLCSLMGALSLSSAASFASVDSPASEQQKPCDGDHDKDQNRSQGQFKPCKSKERTEKFNLVCYYNNKYADRDDKDHDDFKRCKAAATFEKVVTLDGGEVADESPQPSRPLSPEIPRLKVECDQSPLYNDSSHRTTDLLSTRIQGLSGPHPAIYLPRAALHAGFHLSDSNLEIEKGNQLRFLEGKCYVWTGKP